MEQIERTIASLVRDAGGRVFYVGGYVRDLLMGTPNKDIDIEVHGVAPDTLQEILSQVGTPLAFGSSFGVYSLKGYDIDIAMPRKEHATGRGHRDFEVYLDPFIGVEAACRRRDFTINAMLQDVLTGEIVDPYGGRQDLERGVIRHVDDDSFGEDPLRVLRAAQFASRFEFTVAPETVAICRSMDLTPLSRERVEEELKKALLKGRRPSVFFTVLREMDQLETWFPELAQLIGIPQDPVFHPEGDVWTHTMEVLDRATGYRDQAENAYGLMLLALTHDLGKIVTTEEINGRIHAYGHETEGLPIVETFLRRIVSEKAVISYVLNMVPLHMKPNMVAHSRSSVKKTNHMFDQACAPKDLIWMAAADRPLFAGEEEFSGDTEFLLERYEVYRETMSRPYVMGRDLIAAGLTPGDDFTDILAYAHKLRLAGIDKETALKQVLAYARKK